MASRVKSLFKHKPTKEEYEHSLEIKCKQMRNHMSKLEKKVIAIDKQIDENINNELKAKQLCREMLKIESYIDEINNMYDIYQRHLIQVQFDILKDFNVDLIHLEPKADEKQIDSADVERLLNSKRSKINTNNTENTQLSLREQFAQLT